MEGGQQQGGMGKIGAGRGRGTWGQGRKEGFEQQMKRRCG